VETQPRLDPAPPLDPPGLLGDLRRHQPLLLQGRVLLLRLLRLDGQTRERLDVAPGRRLGLLLRGPLVDKVRDYLMGTTLQELKATVERGGV